MRAFTLRIVGSFAAAAAAVPAAFYAGTLPKESADIALGAALGSLVALLAALALGVSAVFHVLARVGSDQPLILSFWTSRVLTLLVSGFGGVCVFFSHLFVTEVAPAWMSTGTQILGGIAYMLMALAASSIGRRCWHTLKSLSPVRVVSEGSAYLSSVLGKVLKPIARVAVPLIVLAAVLYTATR